MSLPMILVAIIAVIVELAIIIGLVTVVATAYTREEYQIGRGTPQSSLQESPIVSWVQCHRFLVAHLDTQMSYHHFLHLPLPTLLLLTSSPLLSERCFELILLTNLADA
jgi:hypothetical protein